MIRLMTISLAAAALLTGPALAQETPPAPAAKTDAAAGADEGADRDKIICRTVKPPTGTRVSRGRTRQRVCLSRADWEQQERDAQEALKARDSGICSDPAQCRG